MRIFLDVFCGNCEKLIGVYENGIAEKYPFWCQHCQDSTEGKYPWWIKPRVEG